MLAKSSKTLRRLIFLLLASQPLLAQPEDVAGWEGIPWCSGHEAFAEKFDLQYAAMPEQQYMEPYGAHYLVRDYQLGGFPFEVQLWEDWQSHGITMVKASRQSGSSDEIVDQYFALQLLLAERFGQPSETRYEILQNGAEHESSHWRFPSTRISLGRRLSGKNNYLAVFFRASREKTRCG